MNAEPHNPPQRRIVFITGMSGAGKSTALNVFEDFGFEAVDNLPLSLLSNLVFSGSGEHSVAIGIDVRTRDFKPKRLLKEINRLRENADFEITLLYLNCSNAKLENRFNTTRRPHPLAHDRRVIDGIKQERELTRPLRHEANMIIDTTSRTLADFQLILEENFISSNPSRLTLFVTSFSFADGVPRESDLVFDVRFLKNPHYVEALHKLDGRDQSIAEYISEDPDFPDFIANLKALIAPLLPRYDKECKSYLTLAIGCTGGRHRSVFVAETLYKWLEKGDYPVRIFHRELSGN